MGKGKTVKTDKKWKQFEYTADPDEMIINISGSCFREYRDKWKRAENLELVQKYPIHLDFELQYGCNLRCSQCILQIDPSELDPDHPYHVSNRRKRISFEKFKEIIKEGIGYGLSSITLCVNNEPLLDPDIKKYIDYARSAGILDVIMITNATLLTDKMAREILDSGLTKLYFSIDAIDKKTYGVIGKGGNLGEVTRNINNFLKLKKEKCQALPVTRVSFVKSKINEAETDEFICYWKDKVDFVSIQAFVSPAYGYSKYKEHMDTFQTDNAGLKNAGACPQPYQRLTIYHDGSVHPCCNWYGVGLNVGSIYSDSIYTIWNSERMKEFRISVNSADKNKVPKMCRFCRKAIFNTSI
jgi:radical SAM protein with 4Fe4S-binding SPASM domain